MEKIDNVNVYTLLVEKDGLIIYCSENLNEYIKLDPINHKISTFLTTESYEYIRKMMLECIFTNKEITDDVNLFNRYFRVNIAPILDEKSNIKNLLIICYDITKNKKIDEEIELLKIKLEESNSIKSIFLSNISHELRTPMNAIIGFSDILLSENKDERFLKSINSNAKHLDELLNNILDYSRLESNEFDILYEKFSVNDLLDELFDIFEDVNYKKNLDFVKLIFEKNNTDIKIISDYLRLKQVLYNIISNSIKFTEKGHIKISFNVNKDIILKIEDTGIGIEKNKIKYVFDRFWQNDSSSTKKYKGTGLGLSISKSIIELLGGKIWLESNFNKGTTFFVSLPLEDIKQEHDVIENKNKINFSGKSILVIDELPINYSLLGMYLTSLNINIFSSYTAKDAIEIYKQQKDKIDIIFIDLNLPDMDSLELATKLKNIKNCKIISKSLAKNFKNKSIDFHLQKPINKEKLLLILNKIWQK